MNNTPDDKSSAKSHNFRIDCLPELQTREQLSQQLSAFFGLKLYNVCTHIVVMQETATETKKIHFHANVIYRTPKKYVTIKGWFDKAFPLHTGGDKSLAVPRKKTNLSYICKDHVIIFKKGYDVDEIHRIGDQWTSTPEEKKQNAITTITSDLKAKYGSEEPWDMADIIIDATIDYYKNRRSCIQRYMMYAVIDGVRLQLDGAAVKQELKAGYLAFSQK